MEAVLYEVSSKRQFARLTLSSPISDDAATMNWLHVCLSTMLCRTRA